MSVLPEQFYRITSSAKSRQLVTDGSLDASFGFDESTAVETHDVKFESVRQLSFVIRDILGFSRKEGVKIFRKVPAQHSMFPTMYANKVSRIEFMAPTGKIQGVGGDASKYRQVRLKVNYATPPYRVVGAEQSGGPETFLNTAGTTEDQRYLQPLAYEARTEFVQQKRDMFSWPTGSTAPQAGSPVPEAGGRTITFPKTRMTFLWVQVPDLGLFDSGFSVSKISTKIMARVGTVNNASFMGFPRGTLLFEGWTPQPRMLPVDPTVFGQEWEIGDTPLTWDVQLVFSYFEPSPVGTHAAGPSGTPAGHNLIPAPNFQWYRILANNAASDVSANWKYAESDLTKIFEMN